MLPINIDIPYVFICRDLICHRLIVCKASLPPLFQRQFVNGALLRTSLTMDNDVKPPRDHNVTSSPVDLDKELHTSDFPDPEKPLDRSTEIAEAAETEYEYVSGVKLWLAVAAVTLVCFLMMLDMSIIVTVSYQSSIAALDSLTCIKGNPSNH